MGRSKLHRNRTYCYYGHLLILLWQDHVLLGNKTSTVCSTQLYWLLSFEEKGFERTYASLLMQPPKNDHTEYMHHSYLNYSVCTCVSVNSLIALFTHSFLKRAWTSLLYLPIPFVGIQESMCKIHLIFVQRGKKLSILRSL